MFCLLSISHNDIMKHSHLGSPCSILNRQLLSEYSKHGPDQSKRKYKHILYQWSKKWFIHFHNQKNLWCRTLTRCLIGPFLGGRTTSTRVNVTPADKLDWNVLLILDANLFLEENLDVNATKRFWLDL